jgi:hypothetical protein
MDRVESGKWEEVRSRRNWGRGGGKRTRGLGEKLLRDDGEVVA